MRWPFVLLIAFASACDWPMTGTSSGGTTGTATDAGIPCSQSNPCNTCASCALSSHCSALWAACQADPSCLSIDGCASGCTDGTCLQNCYAQNPDGASTYQAVHSCVYCEQCPCTGMCF